jgi:hypothetical protein
MNMTRALMLVVAIGVASVASTATPKPETLGCEKYGCKDCSCIAEHKEIKEKIPEALLEIKKVLVANGIPPEAVTVELKGYKGKDKKSLTRLPDATTASCSCFHGCICCKWEFPK